MPKFIICRTYATRHRWTVDAKNEEEALAMLDDETKTPVMEADEEWLGPVSGYTLQELEDNVVPL